jgi:hypothetical protein
MSRSRRDGEKILEAAKQKPKQTEEKLLKAKNKRRNRNKGNKTVQLPYYRH